ncbi:MAG TPA: DUF975 family protein [Coprobacillaceae bacterium]|nr:DUF975 family protein [Coprobacillaceae bacterium]
MNIYDIKNKANEVLRQPNQLFKVILYVGIIQALFSALSGLFDGILGSIISLILSILTVTLGHGIIVASLKVVNNNGNLVDEKEDSLVGIKRFGQLFPTYFLYRVVVALAGIVVGVIGMLLMYTMITDAQFSNLSQLVLMYVNKSTISQDEIVNIVASLSNVFSFVFILVIIISILSVYLSLKFGLFNYILQKYNYTGLTALKESSRLMKGNKWTLFKLKFSFFGWMILAGLVSGVVAMFVETIMPIPFLATFITGVVSTFFSAYFYDVKLNTCFAVFYEELDYADKNSVEL